MDITPRSLRVYDIGHWEGILFPAGGAAPDFVRVAFHRVTGDRRLLTDACVTDPDRWDVRTYVRCGTDGREVSYEPAGWDDTADAQTRMLAEVIA